MCCDSRVVHFKFKPALQRLSQHSHAMAASKMAERSWRWYDKNEMRFSVKWSFRHGSSGEQAWNIALNLSETQKTRKDWVPTVTSSQREVDVSEISFFRIWSYILWKIHGDWYIYLHEWLIFYGINVGKYTIPMDHGKCKPSTCMTRRCAPKCFPSKMPMVDAETLEVDDHLLGWTEKFHQPPISCKCHAISGP